MRKVLVLLCVVALLASCGGASFEETGYYKGKDRHRVFTVTTNTSDSVKLFNHGSSKMNTPKRLTKVYFYTNRSFSHNVTLVNSLDHAIALACNDSCIAVYTCFPTGEERLKMYPNCEYE